MLSLETGACILSPTACFLLQQIYFSSTAREFYLVLLSSAISQRTVCLKLPYCALAKTVQDIKDLMFCRENSALKILCIPVVLWSIMGSLAIKYHLKTQVTAKSLTQNGRQQLLEFEDWHNLVYEFGQMLLSSSFQACC